MTGGLFVLSCQLGMIVALGAITAPPGIAQVLPDRTLGAESSVVTPGVVRGVASDRISGGAQRGQNLFHSFQQFDISAQRPAYFDNPVGVQNIFSRVTGGDRSEILGRLGVLGTANLFLINPNGILFGPTVSLDVGGSFVATSADALQFGDQGSFSTLNTASPANLLTVDPSAFLFNQSPTSAVVLNARGGPISSNPFNQFGLRVPNGRSLILLGGDITNDGGRISALGGRVELGGLRERGVVGLNISGNEFRLTFPQNSAEANVTLGNNARLTVTTGDRGGDLFIHARNINILSDSLILGGIGLNQGTAASQSGNITLNAQETLTISDSLVENSVDAGAKGRSGDVIVEANNVRLTNGGFIAARTFGEGSAGTIRIVGRTSMTLDGSREASFVLNNVGPQAVGNTGGVRIHTRLLTIRDESQIQSRVRGRGRSGDIIINATDAITLDGAEQQSPTRFLPSAIFSDFEGRGGRGGNITIHTGTLRITNRAQVSAVTEGIGDAGNISIHARSNVFILNSLIISEVGQGQGQGRGGNITINTGTLELRNGASLLADTENKGDAGSITITAREGVTVAGTGPSAVNANDVVPSQISTRVESQAQGAGGAITVSTGTLTMRDGAFISSTTEGRGNAGNVRVNANDRISLDGIAPSGSSTGILTSALRPGVFRAGNILLEASSVEMTNGAVVSASTGSNLPGGDITINAGRFTAFNGGQVITTALRSEAAGDINLNAGTVVLSGRDASFPQRMGRRTSNEGNGESGLFANTRLDALGSGGNLTLNAEELLIENGATLSTQSLGRNTGGNISINQAVTDGLTTLQDGSITTIAPNSSGGNITIGGEGLIAFPGSRVIADAQRNAGNIFFPTPGTFIAGGYQPPRSGQNGQALVTIVTISASGESPGSITLPDVSQVENSLSELQQAAIDPDRLIANSCIARTERGGTFLITGSGAFRDRPGDLPRSSYPTGTVRPIPPTNPAPPQSSRPWQLGDPVVEPQGVYQLSDGRLVMSQECS